VTTGVTNCQPPPVIALNPCPDNCLGNGQCLNYTISNLCFDGILDGNETDVDCGGNTCYPCKPGQKCMLATDCYTGICYNTTTHLCGGSGFYLAGSNVSQHCSCNIGYSGNNCGVAPIVPISSAIIGASVGAAAIAGIVLAAVLFCGLAGGGSLAMYNKMSDGDNAPAMSNPLYKESGFSGVNPLAQAH